MGVIVTITDRMAAWRRERRVLRRVSRAAWRLEQAERERAWALASARVEGVSIRTLAAAAGYGTPNPELLGAVPGYERTARSRNFPPGTDLTACGAFLTFHDAAGYAWMRAPDGALTEHPPDQVDDAARAAITRFAAGNRQNQTGEAG
jgi:hypothetical protein